MSPATIRAFWESHRTKREVAYAEFVSPLNERWFLVATSPFVNDRFVTTFVDITEHRRLQDERAKLEEHLQHARKMEAIGTLAAGVAHDFNNIMSGGERVRHKNHSGSIRVRSVLGQGTAFTILLPCTNAQPQTRSVEREVAFRGTGTILLVDDEPQVLRLTSRLLRAMGYEVLQAQSGKASATA